MSTAISNSFNLLTLTRAIEERDAEAQLAMYAPEATVTIADRVTQPGAPRVLHNRGEIAHWITDTCARDMTHVVGQTVQDASGAAFTNACRYSDGTNVLCATVLELSDGLIAHQTIVQAWDERQV